MSKQKEEWIVTSEVARMLGCKIRNVQSHIERGNLKAKKVIDRWLVLRSSVEAYIANPPKRGPKFKKKRPPEP